MERPYRIPLPDKAAFLVVIPPFLGILFIFLVSNWYTYLSCALSVAVGLIISRIRKDVKMLEVKEQEEIEEFSLPKPPYARDVSYAEDISTAVIT